MWCLHEDDGLSFPYRLQKFPLFLSSSYRLQKFADTDRLHGRTQRGFEGGSPNPAGGLGGGVSPPAGSGAEPRKILKLTLFRG